MIKRVRKKMPRLGGRKLLLKLQDQLSGELHLGRDAFFDFLRNYGLLIRKRRFRIRTTNSKHWLRKYPSLIKDFIPDRAHQLWVSDITFIPTLEGWAFLSLITDAYSRKISGWSLGFTFEAKHNIDTLQMALKQLPKNIHNVYHHSDRGIQYCCQDDVRILQQCNFQIRMTEHGDLLENPIAERVNGILKDEWLNHMALMSKKKDTRALIKRIIAIYNAERPHGSINMLVPELAHNQTGEIKRKWKNYYKERKSIDNQQKDATLDCPTEIRLDITHH